MLDDDEATPFSGQLSSFFHELLDNLRLTLSFSFVSQGWNSGYDRRGGRGRGSPGIDIDPREMALFMSDMLKKMRPRSRREDSRSERPSPIFAWEAT